MQERRDKLILESNKILAETVKLNLESSKLTKEVRWFELIIISGIVIALIAAGKYLL